MSMFVKDDSGNNLRVKTVWHPSPGGPKYIVQIGDNDLPMDQFLEAKHYVLTGTDLLGDADARLDVVERIKTAEIFPGYNDNGRRIEIPRPHRMSI